MSYKKEEQEDLEPYIKRIQILIPQSRDHIYDSYRVGGTYKDKTIESFQPTSTGIEAFDGNDELVFEIKYAPIMIDYDKRKRR